MQVLKSQNVAVSRYIDTGIGWWDTSFSDSVSLKRDDDTRRILFNGIDERLEVDFLRRFVESSKKTREYSRSWFNPFAQEPEEPEASGMFSSQQCIVSASDEDTSGPCRLYLLVGLVVPTAGTNDTQSPPVLRSCTLACTSAYIYLLLER